MFFRNNPVLIREMLVNLRATRSFVLLFIINALQRWSEARSGKRT